MPCQQNRLEILWIKGIKQIRTRQWLDNPILSRVALQ